MRLSRKIIEAPESITSKLLTRYYPDGKAFVPGASSHWQAYSRNFELKYGPDGNVEQLFGYGFGESDRVSVGSRVCSYASRLFHHMTLKARGLRDSLRVAKETVANMGLHFTQDAFRQACTDWFLAQWVSNVGGGDIKCILVIGDGPGMLAGLLHRRYPEARILLMDLGATLVFQANNLAKAYPDADHALLDPASQGQPVATFTYCPADMLEHLPEGRIDLAVNVASMQEMTHPTINAYFSLLRARATRLFYCCNRLEKHLPNGDVIKYMDYPWSPHDIHIIDEACPWHQWFVGRSAAPRVRLGPVAMPLLHRYDGITWHRFSLLSCES